MFFCLVNILVVIFIGLKDGFVGVICNVCSAGLYKRMMCVTFYNSYVTMSIYVQDGIGLLVIPHPTPPHPTPLLHAARREV